MSHRSGSGSGNRSEDLRFGKVMCCVSSSHVSAELNKLAGSARHSDQEAWPSGQCRTRGCWHNSASAMRRMPLPLCTLSYSMLPRAVVTIVDDEDDFGTDVRMHAELKRGKMENCRLRRRCGRLRIKLAIIGEGSRAVSTKCAHVNFEASLVPAWYDLPSIVSS